MKKIYNIKNMAKWVAGFQVTD